MSTLAYDRSLNREGVAIDREPGWFRLITPRAMLSSTRPLAYALIAILFFLSTLTAAIMFQQPRGQRLEVIPAVVECAFFLLIAVLFVITRANQRFIFEVTPAHFVMTRIDFSSSRRRWIFRRDAITGINASVANGSLSIHARGQDLIELFISRDQRIVQQVAEELTNALRDTVGDFDRSLPDLLEEPTVRRPAARYALIATSVAIVIAGIVLIAMRPMLAPVGCYVLPLAGIPLGILYGTQKKDYYM